MFIVLVILSCVTWSIAAQTEGNTTIVSLLASSAINVTDSSTENSNESNQNVSSLRITQPTTNIETYTVLKLASSKLNNESSKSDFVPSPQLESYIEYNHFPVMPAYPEPKHTQVYNPPSMVISNMQAQDKYGLVNSKYDKNIENHKLGYDNSGGKISTTVKPQYAVQEKQLFPTSYEKPFRNENDYMNQKYYGPAVPSNNLFPTMPAIPWYNKVIYPAKSSPIPTGEHPYHFYGSEYTKHELTPSFTYPKSGYGMSPWKKAAKIFAAILPIGLLISALTPNILTIGPANTTSSQCRKLGKRVENHNFEKLNENWAEPGCEARLLCETAVKENNLDPEVVKNLFWSFVSQNAEDVETAKELEAVSKAIKNKSCETIHCRQIMKRHDTGRDKSEKDD